MIRILLLVSLWCTMSQPIAANKADTVASALIAGTGLIGAPFYAWELVSNETKLAKQITTLTKQKEDLQKNAQHLTVESSDYAETIQSIDVIERKLEPLVAEYNTTLHLLSVNRVWLNAHILGTKTEMALVNAQNIAAPFLKIKPLTAKEIANRSPLLKKAIALLQATVYLFRLIYTGSANGQADLKAAYLYRYTHLLSEVLAIIEHLLIYGTISRHSITLLARISLAIAAAYKTHTMQPKDHINTFWLRKFDYWRHKNNPKITIDRTTRKVGHNQRYTTITTFEHPSYTNEPIMISDGKQSLITARNKDGRWYSFTKSTVFLPPTTIVKNGYIIPFSELSEDDQHTLAGSDRYIKVDQGSLELAIDPKAQLIFTYPNGITRTLTNVTQADSRIVFFENQPCLVSKSNQQLWHRIVFSNDYKTMYVLTPEEIPQEALKHVTNLSFDDEVTTSTIESSRKAAYMIDETKPILSPHPCIIEFNRIIYTFDPKKPSVWFFIHPKTATLYTTQPPHSFTIAETNYSPEQLTVETIDKLSKNTGLIISDAQERTVIFDLPGNKTLLLSLETQDNFIISLTDPWGNTVNYLLNTTTKSSQLVTINDTDSFSFDSNFTLPPNFKTKCHDFENVRGLDSENLRSMLSQAEPHNRCRIEAEVTDKPINFEHNGYVYHFDDVLIGKDVIIKHKGQLYVYNFASKGMWQRIVECEAGTIFKHHPQQISDDASFIENQETRAKVFYASLAQKTFDTKATGRDVAVWYDNAPMLVAGPFIIMHQRQPYRITPGVEKWERILPNDSVAKSDPFDIVINGEVYEPNTLTEETLTKLSRNGLITTDDQSPSAVFTVGDYDVLDTKVSDTTFILSYEGNTYKVHVTDDGTSVSCFKIDGEGKVTLKNEAPLPAQVVIHNGTNYESINLASSEADGIRESLRNAQNLVCNSGVIQAHKRDPLPTFKDCTAISLPDEICSICQEKLIDDSIETEDPIKTVCNHYFHLTCLRDALANSQYNICPICRNEIV